MDLTHSIIKIWHKAFPYSLPFKFYQYLIFFSIDTEQNNLKLKTMQNFRFSQKRYQLL
jgi:hypothetical protein